MFQSYALIMHRAAIGLVAGLISVVGASPRTMSTGHELPVRRDLDRQQAAERLREVRSELGAALLCIRFPARGPMATIVVRTDNGARKAAELLRRSNVDGSVEVASIFEYNSANYRVAVAVRRGKPAAFRHVHIFQELYGNGHTGQLECPRVYIEVGERGRVGPSVIDWARHQVQRIDDGRVAYRFDLPLEPL
jgi:hypothetical protein